MGFFIYFYYLVNAKSHHVNKNTPSHQNEKIWFLITCGVRMKLTHATICIPKNHNTSINSSSWNDGSISVLIDKGSTFCNHTWLWETILSTSRKEDKCFSFTLGYVFKRLWQLVFCWLAYTPLIFKNECIVLVTVIQRKFTWKNANQDA